MSFKQNKTNKKQISITRNTEIGYVYYRVKEINLNAEIIVLGCHITQNSSKIAYCYMLI